MSLRSFHICFIVLAILLAIGFGFWGLRDYAVSSNLMHRNLGIGSFVVAIVLAGYLVWFLSKMRKLGSSR